MGKILIVSDVHINDYAHRNPSYRYRLYQSRTVAQNIVKVARQAGADTLFIAGDLIHKSVNRPYVMAEVKLFLDTLMGYFREGRIIYGNHDLDSKLPDQGPSDCILSVMLPGNLKYADRTVEVFGNSTVAFSNWRQGEIPLDFIQGHVDFLITHATIAYTGDFFESTVLDESKFGLCITGDIHKPDQKPGYVSIGIPQRNSLGDSEKATGVLLDPDTKTWSWVDLNPDDNLLKFQYTTDQAAEGYRPDNNTWYVYRPVRDLTPTPGSPGLALWEEVDDLIQGIIERESLVGIHSGIIQGLPGDTEDIDPRFTLTALRCENWRSVGSLTMSLSPGDRVILSGANGSGKSSILTALKYALLDHPRYKSFACNKSGSDECWTEVDFLYQGHSYTLRRGTASKTPGKTWGLWIDGVLQPYQKVSDFKVDVMRRFRFLEILDYFYFDDSHARFLGDLKNEEKPLLIAKLLKLEKIDHYHSAAGLAKAELKKTTDIQGYRKVDVSGRLERLRTTMAGLRVPGTSRAELEKAKADGYALQAKANAWMEWMTRNQAAKAKESAILSELKGIEDTLSGAPRRETLLTELSEVTTALTEAKTRQLQAATLEGRVRELSRTLSEIRATGTKVYQEYTNLRPDTCPTCGQSVRSEIFQGLQAELGARLTELTTRQTEVSQELEKTTAAVAGESGIPQEVKRLEGRSREIETVLSRLAELGSRAARLQSELAELRGNGVLSGEAPEQVTLPPDALQIMASIEADLAGWTRIEETQAEIVALETELRTIESEIAATEAGAADLEKYLKVTSPTGEIYQSVLSRVAAEFSDNQVVYEAYSFCYGKKEHLDLASYFVTPGGAKVAYESASSGQKTLMDLHLMSRLTNGLGLIVFDEFLKSLDPGNHDEMLTLIQGMGVGLILLVSHQTGISGFQNKTIELELGPDGMTNTKFL